MTYFAGSEAEMRNALRFAREKGMEKLGVYKEVLAHQQGLYGKLLQPRLERLVSEDADFGQLGAVHQTAEAHGLEELARRVLTLGEKRLKAAIGLETEEALQKSLQVRDEAKAGGWFRGTYGATIFPKTGGPKNMLYFPIYF